MPSSTVLKTLLQRLTYAALEDVSPHKPSYEVSDGAVPFHDLATATAKKPGKDDPKPEKRTHVFSVTKDFIDAMTKTIDDVALSMAEYSLAELPINLEEIAKKFAEEQPVDAAFIPWIVTLSEKSLGESLIGEIDEKRILNLLIDPKSKFKSKTKVIDKLADKILLFMKHVAKINAHHALLRNAGSIGQLSARHYLYALVLLGAPADICVHVREAIEELDVVKREKKAEAAEKRLAEGKGKKGAKKEAHDGETQTGTADAEESVEADADEESLEESED